MAEAKLEFVDVTAGYGRSMVIHGVSLSVPLGGGVALMGHNGAGKTSLLRVAVGLLPVRSGKVLIDGEDVTRLRPNKRVARGLGYVPQGQLSFPQMTTLENLQLVTSEKTAIDEVLDTFPALRELLGRRAGLL
jgi:urea transport system ATP-binding protein